MPHREETPSDREFAPNQHPEFPDGFPTVALETISLAKLLGDRDRDGAKSESEADRVFEACRGRGFFYLDLAGCAAGEAIARGADRAAAVAEDVFKLPLEEKMRYQLEPGRGSLDGYKVRGATFVDPAGMKDTAEFFNVGKNESESNLAYFSVLPRVSARHILTLGPAGSVWISLRGWRGGLAWDMVKLRRRGGRGSRRRIHIHILSNCPATNVRN